MRNLYKETSFTEAVFVGGKDAKGREESWKVTVNEVEWMPGAESHFAERFQYLVGSEFSVKVQKQKDGKQFGATQSSMFAKDEKAVNKAMESAKKKATASAAK